MSDEGKKVIRIPRPDPNEVPDENVLELYVPAPTGDLLEQVLNWQDPKARLWIVKSKNHNRAYAVQFHNYDGLNLWTCTCPHHSFAGTDCSYIGKVQQLVIEES